VAKYQELLSAAPTNSDLLYLCGRVAQNRAEASQLFQQATNSNPGNPYPLYALGYDRMTAGDWPAARSLMGRAAQLAPSDRGFSEPLLFIRFASKEYEAIEKELQTRVGNEPIDALSEIMLIETLAALGRNAEALSAGPAFERRWRSQLGNERQALSASLQRHALYAIGDFAGLEKAASTDQSRGGKGVLAEALLEQGRLDEAVKLQFPEDAEESLVFQLSLAVAFNLAGNADAAAAWKDRAIKAMENSSWELSQASELLAGSAAPRREDWAGLSVSLPLKALTLTLLAQMHPEAKAELAAAARLLNVQRQFPYHLVQRATADARPAPERP
jgi:hypothetical protein